MPILLLINTSLKTLPEFFKDPAGLSPGINLENFVNAWNL
ncbi:MAG: carbohydrate ABC transporter permease, partial [Pseudomonadales bacterium]|nr:carbohydrate ABC transporter permease [Pseudomonadales bacterium]NIX09759.1 carbohydrate ABC transporter permease [Pseudomonadales bacterium]